MSQSDTTAESTPLEIDPIAYDYSTEEAVYQRDRKRLVQEHLGKFVAICGEELVGVFDTFGEAVLEGRRRFGWGPLMVRDIVEDEVDSEYFPHVDVNDPTFRRIDS